jgi:hypothetical protein
MAKKNKKRDKELSKAADLILDLLSELPSEKAKAARREIKALARSSRSASLEKSSRRQQSADFHLSRPARVKSA